MPHIPFPKFDWKVNDKLAHFEQWEQRMRVLLDGYEIPQEKWHMYILNNLRDEGWARWSTISKKVDAKDMGTRSSKHSRKAWRSQTPIGQHVRHI